jgi:transcriptional regulator with XRE-family HTH domain
MIFVMQLSAWLEIEGMTQEVLARRVGVSQSRVAQLVAGELPSLALAQRIFVATGGEVTPNDFAGLVRA